MGFSADWLALREPADHRARDAGLAARVAAALAGRDPVRIVDLGCGAGSNLRALAPRLGPRQSWRLVDYDPALLDAARARLAAWAERAEDAPDGLVLHRDGRRIAVSFLQADLTAGLDRVLAGPVDLVTAAALFDLVSVPWIDAFAARLARDGLPLYTTLIYDGTEHWDPPHPTDAAVLAAFVAHQGTDKGFGPAAGPGAGPAMAAAFTARGYAVERAASPWRLGDPDRGLIGELAAGIAAAAVETGRVPSADGRAWAAARAAATAAVVGHVDLWAVPPG